jgi:hypothetical protein
MNATNTNTTQDNLPRDDDGQLSKWAWPGGYPIFYIDGNNSILCPDCARKSDADPDELPQFKIIAADVNWEDPNLYCEDCSAPIESAYAGD